MIFFIARSFFVLLCFFSIFSMTHILNLLLMFNKFFLLNTFLFLFLLLFIYLTFNIHLIVTFKNDLRKNRIVFLNSVIVYTCDFAQECKTFISIYRVLEYSTVLTCWGVIFCALLPLNYELLFYNIFGKIKSPKLIIAPYLLS